MKILIGALLAATALQAQTPDVTGDWQATLKAGAAELRLVLHITKTAAGLTATFDSVDQGAKGIPLGPVTLADRTLSFESTAMRAKYEGKLSADSSQDRKSNV